MEQKSRMGFRELREQFFLKAEASRYSESYKHYFRIEFACLEKFAAQKGFTGYSPEVGAEFLADYVSSHDVGASSKKLVKTFIAKVNDIYDGHGFCAHHTQAPEPPPDGFRKVLEDYAVCCSRKGNRQSTIDIKMRSCISLCIFAECCGCTEPRQLTAPAISQFCLQVCSQDRWRFAREFLRFLYENGYTEKDYSYAVPKAVKSRTLPSVYSPEEIRRIESAVDVSTATGKRDICILLLASRLAMRAGDIVKLSFDEIDFKNDRITFFQEKTGEPQSLPLLPEIKAALEGYIKDSRPDSSEEKIFLSLYAPYRPLTTSVTRRITACYMKKSGVEPGKRRHGSHIFRSSAATSMVNDGVSYEIVRHTLGHKDPNVVQHYAALNISSLRQCALPAPEPGGFFKELLEGRAAL